MPYTAADALNHLLEGNRRFREDRPQHPFQAETIRRNQASHGQHPIAAVLGCADSRVPPELIFDCGLGELFVVRTAGHAIDDIVLGSLEFAVRHLAVNLIMVMGHTQCGAVTTAVEREMTGHKAAIGEALAPAIGKARQQEANNVIDAAIRLNAQIVADKLRRSDLPTPPMRWSSSPAFTILHREASR